MAEEIILALTAISELITAILRATSHPGVGKGTPTKVDRAAIITARAKIDAILAKK